MLVNKELIERVLTAFLVLAQKEPGRFDPRDVRMVKTKQWWTERHILNSPTEAEAIKTLIETMEWRKSYGINDFKEDSFPKELHDLGHLLFQSILNIFKK